MAISKPAWAWINGRYLPWDECVLHVRTQAIMVGGSVFEGVRAYWNPSQEELYVFRLKEHMHRLSNSMKIMRMPPMDLQALAQACVDLLSRNDFREDIHSQPFAYAGVGEDFGAMNPSQEHGLFLTAVPRPQSRTLADGLNVCISSWQRISDSSMPPRVKSAANYQNSRLALMEARAAGYQNAILLNSQGTVAEATGACVFAVRAGQVCTPPVTDGILESITRSTLTQLFQEKLGRSVVERPIDRTELYLAEEVFLCGSGVEVTPVVKIDGIQVADGRRGPVTKAAQEIYFAVVRGQDDAYRDWLTPVYGRGAAGSGT